MLRPITLPILFSLGASAVCQTCSMVDVNGFPVGSVRKQVGWEQEEPMYDTSSAILAGLLLPLPRISQTFLYDERGSQLYEQIVQQEEYYLPGAEVRLLQDHMASIGSHVTPVVQDPELSFNSCSKRTNGSHDMAEKLSQGLPTASQVVIELGAGAGHKTMALLRHMAKEAVNITYVPMDISRSALVENQRYFQSRLETLTNVNIHPLCGTHESCMPDVLSIGGRRTYLFMGSSLGNLDDSEIHELLHLVRSTMATQDRFLLAVDREHGPAKSVSKISAAYNDAAGITAEFTLNALVHVNRVAGLDFRTSGWKHVAAYDQTRSAIVTHVEAVGPQTVHDAAHRVVRKFKSGDRIFIEQSRKFSVASVSRLAAVAGLALSRQFVSDDYIIVELRRNQTSMCRFQDAEVDGP